MKRLSDILLSLLVIGMFGCSSGQKETAKQDLKPNSKDTLQPLMAKAQQNLTNLTAALMVFDQAKAVSSAENLIETGNFIRELTNVQHRGSSIEWKAFSDEQAAIAEEIQQLAQNKDFATAAEVIGKLINSCLHCHKPYRFSN